jgi:hypothetical protein
MWVLMLNDMRASQVEILHPVCRAESREALEAFLERESVAGYQDGQWGKAFRQGGPLEWYNPPWMPEESFLYMGTEDDHAERARQKYRENVMSLPDCVWLNS